MKKYLRSLFVFALFVLLLPSGVVYADEPSTTEEDAAENYAVTYNLNGGENDETNLTEYENSAEVTLAEPWKEGYVFDGWYTTETFDEGTKLEKIEAGNKEDVTVWAKWSALVYTITYDVTSGVSLSENPKTTYTIEDEDFELPVATFENYTFIGWCKESDLSDTPLTKIEKGSTGSLRLYPKFTHEDIVFESDGLSCRLVYGGAVLEKGTFSANYAIPQTVTYNDAEYNVVGISGDFFADASNVESILFPENIDDIESVDFSKCTALKSIVVYFGGLTLPDSLPKSVDLLTYFGTVTAENYLDLEFTGKLSYFTSKINLNLDGGTVTGENPLTYNVRERITLEEPTKAGYIFDGWYTKDTFDEETLCYNRVFYSEELEDISLYAKWIKEFYNIQYELNGGTNASDNTATYKRGVGLVLQNPTRSGYRFDGWYEDAQFTKRIRRITTAATKDYVLYAKWTPFGATEAESTVTEKQYKITYNLKGGTNSAKNVTSYDSGEAVTLYAPTRKKYKFLYWCTDAGLKHKITGIPAGTTGDITLYAKWSKVTVKKNSIKSVSNKSGKKLYVKFGKISGVAGYQIQYSTSKKFKKNGTKYVYPSKKKSTYTIKKLKKGKTYYVRIRGYKKDSTGEKVYGKWSSKKTIKIYK